MPDLPEALDLGKGCHVVAYRWCLHEPKHHCWQATPDEPAECSCGNKDNCPAPEIVGWVFKHPQPSYKHNGITMYPDDECYGLIYIKEPFTAPSRPTPVWTVVAAVPLTLTPSVLCSVHPEWHAFITDGRWTG